MNFDWKHDSPLEGLRNDQFSVVWDTCLVLQEPRRAAFSLASDDGARLWMNRKLVLDNWRDGWHARGARVELPRGVYHLRVEYREVTGRARIGLTASFDGKKPRPLPAALLRRPLEPLDDKLPCASSGGP